MRDRTAGSPAGTAGSADDNICVAYSRATSSMSPLQWAESKGFKRPETNNYVGKGKAPVRPIEQDADMMDVDQSDLDDDNVTEYSFKTEDYPHSSESEDSGDEDARSHISLSDDEPEVPSVLESVDWKDLTRDQRIEYERMFSSMQHAPLNGSWNFTEDYQNFVDSQCFEYLQVFELDAWVLPYEDAKYIIAKLLERVRLRKAELKVYGPPLPHNHGPRSQPGQYYNSQSSFPPPGLQVPQSYLPSQPTMQPMSVPLGVNLGQPLRQPMTFAQSQQYQHGNLPVGYTFRPATARVKLSHAWADAAASIEVQHGSTTRCPCENPSQAEDQRCRSWQQRASGTDSSPAQRPHATVSHARQARSAQDCW
jgi:hypothetical protein